MNKRCVFYDRRGRIFFSLILILFLSGCGKKEERIESPEFTRGDLSFTGDRQEAKFSDVRFTDITEEAGIHFKHVTGAFGEKWMPETVGSGGGFLDYDNDGRMDIFLVNSSSWPGHGSGPNPLPALYRNMGNGKFEDVTIQAGLDFSIYGMGTCFADFDADGDIDIYLTAVGNNKLLRNDHGKFTDITALAKVTGNDPGPGRAPAWSTGAAWVDVDRDGWLDLVVANYVKWTPETDIFTTRDGKTKSYATPDVYEGESCRLYRNIRGQHFEDITDVAGLLNEEGKSLGVAIADFNNDDWPDIVIVNDTQPNFLYMNNGNGTFVNKAVVAGIGYDENGRARAGMGVDVADLKNDGRLAIAIGNFSREPISLYTQIGNGDLFQDLAGSARLTRPSLLQLTFGVLFVDLNLDGYQDLVVANGHIEPEINAVQKDITFAQKPQLFFNDQGKFVDISAQAGTPFNEPVVGRGLAWADIDQDGDPDLLFTVNGGSPRLLRNDTENDSNYIKVRLKGENPNWQAIGAKVSVWSDGMRQQRMVRTGSSYLSQSDVSTLIFGLNESKKADSIIVRWPLTGNESRLSDLPAGDVYVIEEEGSYDAAAAGVSNALTAE
ncbi:MAG: CRTAC1 family protein [Cyclobacteriaceae bacterium]|nr:CRTAC1 family protein [Cyclobacteriaceae bacterium]